MSNERIIAREKVKMVYGGKYNNASKFVKDYEDPFDLNCLFEAWVMDPETEDYMLAIRSRHMGPHYLELTREDFIWLLLEAHHKGWFEDV